MLLKLINNKDFSFFDKNLYLLFIIKESETAY